MSVANAEQEVKTAILNVEVVAGGSEIVARDAMEDREIVGVALGQVAPSGNAIGFLFIGTDPYATGDFTQDNEQFAMQGPLGVNPGPQLATFNPADRPDWNEDATLTLEVGELGGTDGSEYTAHVYYVEV